MWDVPIGSNENPWVHTGERPVSGEGRRLEAFHVKPDKLKLAGGDELRKKMRDQAW